MLLNLHGGVMRPDLTVNSRPEKLDAAWGCGVDEGLYALVAPVTNERAPWWTHAGTEFIFSVIDQVQSMIPVDVDRVFCMGYSDGASGAFYLALNHPTRFAGFICINGSLSAASNGGHVVFPRNLRNRVLLVMNAGQDEVFSPFWITRDIEALKLAGLTCHARIGRVAAETEALPPDNVFLSSPLPKLLFHMWEDCGHNPSSYLHLESANFREFFTRTSRAHCPSEIDWTAECSSRGRCDWISIDRIAPLSPGETRFYDHSTASVVVQPPGRRAFARIRAWHTPGKITVETTHVVSFSIHLRPDLLGPDGSLEIELNGNHIFRELLPLDHSIAIHRGQADSWPHDVTCDGCKLTITFRS